MKRIWISLILSIVLTGCEGHFAGERAYNIQILNGNYQMKIVSVGGTSYLAVLNTNSQFRASTGSLQFYSLTDADAPSRQSAMSLELPSNAGDFEVDGSSLYVADRNLHQILIYDLSGSVFQKRVDSQSQPVVINVTDQPQRLVVFTRAADSVKVLAIVCQGSGMIHFVRLDTLEFLSKGDSGTPDLALVNGIPGANLFTIPRQTVADKDDSISLPQPVSFGINPLIYLGGAEQVFVTASELGMGLFGFRLDTFQNASNFAWNLPEARDGTTVNGQNHPGTKENGFRGLARDGAGTVYAVSRADNGLYKIARSEFAKSKSTAGTETVATRNTQGYADNDTTKQILTFDTDLTDTLFPRLTQVVVNYCPNLNPVPTNCTGDNDPTATVGWVLGLGTTDGDKVLAPKVYRVNLTTNALTDTSADSALGNSPQRILWYYPASRLYVGNVKSDTISILKDSDLSLVGTIRN